MKIRTGFISNSSSSSFVVAFPHIPMSAEEVHELLFGADHCGFYPHDEHEFFNKQAVVVEMDDCEIIRARGIGIFTTMQVAKTVWEDIRDQTPNNTKIIRDILSRDSSVNVDSYRKSGTLDIDWVAYHKESKRVAAIEAGRTLKKWKGQKIYTFQYSDNNGHYGSAMEHGGLFDRLPHKQISEH